MRNRKKNLPQSTTALYTCLAGARPGLRDFVDIGLGGEMPGAVDGGSENNDSSPPPLFVVIQEGQGLRSEERYNCKVVLPAYRQNDPQRKE